MKVTVNRRLVMVCVLVAAVLMIMVDLYMLLQTKSSSDDLRVVDSVVFTHSEVADYNSATAWKDLNVPPAIQEKYTVERPQEMFGPSRPEIVAERPKDKPVQIVKKEPEPEIIPEPVIRHEGEPAKIVVIIDDMGMDRKRSQKVINLDGALTLAFLPYAPNIGGMTNEALSKGHELMIHMPMQPIDKSLSTGPIALKAGMTDLQMLDMLEQAFHSFAGFKGMNNHMGSGLTQNAAAMKVVMKALKERNMYFVDSKTIGSSVASREAAYAGLRHADRDVFLDHQETPQFARAALRQLERVANKKGYAIAIGHPKDVTINALKEWLPTLKDRGFELVPASVVVKTSQIKMVEKEEKPVAKVVAAPIAEKKVAEEKVVEKKQEEPEKIAPAAGPSSVPATPSSAIDYQLLPQQVPLPVSRPSLY